MNIKISKKHGVNPSVLVCAICGKDTSVALLGHLKGDEEAPRKMIDQVPCEDCIKNLNSYRDKGIVLIVVRDEYHDTPEETPVWPYFLRLFVVKEDADFLKDQDTSQRILIMANSMANDLGLTEESEA